MLLAIIPMITHHMSYGNKAPSTPNANDTGWLTAGYFSTPPMWCNIKKSAFKNYLQFLVARLSLKNCLQFLVTRLSDYYSGSTNGRFVTRISNKEVTASHPVFCFHSVFAISASVKISSFNCYKQRCCVFFIHLSSISRRQLCLNFWISFIVSNISGYKNIFIIYNKKQAKN